MVKKGLDDCKMCGHPKRYHANKLEHELGTSHCTHVSADNIYCHCQEYTG